MLNILAFSYNELLLITTHCSWMVNKKNIYIILTNSLFSHFSLLSSLSCAFVCSWWFSDCGLMIMVHQLWSIKGCGSDSPMVVVLVLGSQCDVFNGLDYFFFCCCLWLQVDPTGGWWQRWWVDVVVVLCVRF